MPYDPQQELATALDPSAIRERLANPSDELLNAIMGAMPIGAGGMIKPETWKAANPVAKALMTMAANRWPKVFQKVLQHPTDIQLAQKPTLGQGNLAQVIDDSMGLQRKYPQYRLGPNSQVVEFSGAKELTKDPSIVLHEMQHLLDYRKFPQASVEDVVKWGQALKQLLGAAGKPAGSLNSALNYAVETAPKLAMYEKTPPIQGSLAKLAEHVWGEGRGHLVQAVGQGPTQLKDFASVMKKTDNPLLQEIMDKAFEGLVELANKQGIYPR